MLYTYANMYDNICIAYIHMLFQKTFRFDFLFAVGSFWPAGFLQTLQELKATDAWTLFQSIDHNEDFKINLEDSQPARGKWIPSSWKGGPVGGFPVKGVLVEKNIDENRDDLKDGSQHETLIHMYVNFEGFLIRYTVAHCLGK